MKKTKIICTVGPSTDEEQILTKIIDEGMDIARLNFSHGSYKEHEKRLELLNKIALEKNTYIATIADTKGPEMRLGEFVNGGVMLEPNSQFCITIENVLGNENIASVNYANLVEDLHIGNRILLSDGLLELVVEKIQGTKIYTKVIHGGYISSRKRLAVPGIELKLPFLSKEDEKDILFAIEHKMDYIAASFTQNVENVFDIKRILEAHNSNIGIIAKIENHEGVKNIDSLLDVVDGVMVARGDLGVEIDAEMVPIVQKEIIKKCNEAGIFVITATQMLESMTNNYRATRAEASDVANSIFDGTDAIMLSGETASGKYPVEAVRTMAKIAITTEKALNYLNIFQSKGLKKSIKTTEAISHATVQLSYELNVDAIVSVTETGQTARMISKYRPASKILAISPKLETVRKMKAYWGVTPILNDSSKNTDKLIELSIEAAKRNGLLKDGDLVVVTAGVPVGIVGTTNLIKVIQVGEKLLNGIGIGQGSYYGKIKIIKNLNDLKTNFNVGDIAVLNSAEDEMGFYLQKAGAIICEDDSLTSNVAIIGINNHLPVIVGCHDAVNKLMNIKEVTLDASAGIVYKGKANVK